MVVWHSVGSAGSDTDSYSIQGQRYDANGSAVGGQFQVNTYTTSFQFFPAAAVDVLPAVPTLLLPVIAVLLVNIAVPSGIDIVIARLDHSPAAATRTLVKGALGTLRRLETSPRSTPRESTPT